MRHGGTSDKCKMPLATTDRLRFIEFLGLLAGLFVVFVSTNPGGFIYLPFGLPDEAVFVLLLIVFIAYSLFVYAQILSREKTVPSSCSQQLFIFRLFYLCCSVELF